jgi:septal ring factor EnvC (AmiA/AmiB activator)
MRRLTPIGAALLVLALPSCMPAASPSMAHCRAELDRRLAALEYEEQSLRAMIDTDAAVVNALEFQLRKTERALLKMVQADKDAARARYRACLRRPPSGEPKRR